MKYLTPELAKELRDAGFPQEGFSAYWMQHDGEEPFLIHPSWDNRTVQSYRDGAPLSEVIAAPTLEELIQECGPTMFGLRYVGSTDSDGTWIASKDIYRGEFPVRVEAEEPSIKAAVGRVWLSLNKKS